MSSVRSPARLWISSSVAAAATCLTLIMGVSLVIPFALWIGVVFDWYCSQPLELQLRPARVPPRPAPTTSWIAPRGSQAT